MSIFGTGFLLFAVALFFAWSIAFKAREYPKFYLGTVLAAVLGIILMLTSVAIVFGRHMP